MFLECRFELIFFPLTCKCTKPPQIILKQEWLLSMYLKKKQTILLVCCLSLSLYFTVLIDNCVRLLIRPPPLKLLDFVFTPVPSHVFISCSLHLFGSILRLLSLPSQHMFQKVLQGFLSVSLSTDISAPWFQRNYIRITDDSHWMHFFLPSCQPHQEKDLRHSNHSLSLLCRRAPEFLQSLRVKTKGDLFFLFLIA